MQELVHRLVAQSLVSSPVLIYSKWRGTSQSVDCSVWSHVTSHDSTYTQDNLQSIIWNHRPLHTVLTISCWFVRTSHLSTFKSHICVKLGIKPKSPVLNWPPNNHQPLHPSNGRGCLVVVATCTIHSGVVCDSVFTNTCALRIEGYEGWWLFGSCSWTLFLYCTILIITL